MDKVNSDIQRCCWLAHVLTCVLEKESCVVSHENGYGWR